MNLLKYIQHFRFPCGSVVKNLPAKQEMHVRSLDWEDSLEKEMATHSSMLAWEIPQTEEIGRLQSMGSERGGHDLATKEQWHCSISKNHWEPQRIRLEAKLLGLVPKTILQNGPGKKMSVDTAADYRAMLWNWLMWGFSPSIHWMPESFLNCNPSRYQGFNFTTISAKIPESKTPLPLLPSAK